MSLVHDHCKSELSEVLNKNEAIKRLIKEKEDEKAKILREREELKRRIADGRDKAGHDGNLK